MICHNFLEILKFIELLNVLDLVLVGFVLKSQYEFSNFHDVYDFSRFHDLYNMQCYILCLAIFLFFHGYVFIKKWGMFIWFGIIFSILWSTEDGCMIRKWPAEHGRELQPKYLWPRHICLLHLAQTFQISLIYTFMLWLNVTKTHLHFM